MIIMILPIAALYSSHRLLSYPTAPHPERTPSHDEHRQLSTSSHLRTHTGPCQGLRATAPPLPDLASTSTLKTASATSGSPLSRAARSPTPCGSCTSGSSAISSAMGAPRRRSTLPPRTILLGPAPHPPCPPRLQRRGWMVIRAVCRCRPRLQMSPRLGLWAPPAELFHPHVGRTCLPNG